MTNVEPRWWSGPSTAESEAILNSIDALAGRVASPEACDEWERSLRFPHEAMTALAEGGWAALAVPEQHGGEDASAQQLVVVHRALARHSLVLAQSYYSLWVLAADAIARLGTPEQREHWLPRIASGTSLVAFALTEPGSGSDAAALRSRAVRDGDHFVVNGQKTFITGAAVSDCIVTAVRTQQQAERPRDGISLLMIDPSLPGVTVRPIDKLGLKALDLCEVFLEDVRVPVSAVLGKEGGAWKQLKAGLAKERLFLAAICVGALDDIIGRVLHHARLRDAFGQPIGAHQLIAAKIVGMRIANDAAAALTRKGADLIDAGDPEASVSASAAKLFASDAYVTATREAVQIFGGYGFTNDYPVARHYRDAKYLEIGGGTTEIQTLIIARAMGLGA